jgi:hypothetical protein
MDGLNPNPEESRKPWNLLLLLLLLVASDVSNAPEEGWCGSGVFLHNM